MNVLVTGGTGFLGRALVERLLDAGHSVNYLARKRSAALDSRAAYFHWPGAGEEPSLAGGGRFDGVIHLAGEPVAQRWSTAVKKRIGESRILGTSNLIRALGQLRHKPAVLVSASAIGYYGDRDNQVLTEESGPGQGYLADLCVAWEREALAAREIGLRVVTVRIGVVLDIGGGAFQAMLPIFRAGLGGKLGTGRQWMSWIHRDDAVRLLQFALENPLAAGALNATSPNPVTNQEFTRALGKALRRPALLPVPRFALQLAMGEMGEHILDSARVLPAGPQRLGFTFRHQDLPETLESILDPRKGA